MGRPLNKKYFGNRNIGTTGTGDDGIGGSRIASVTLGTLGSYTTRPTVTFSDPDLLGAGGVRATGTVTSEVLSVSAVGGTQTGYTVGQLVTVDGTDAVLRVATIGGTGGDDALTFDFTGGSRGNFTTLPTGAQTTTSNGAGAGLTVTLAFRAKAVVMTDNGSGYTDATDAAPTFTESVTGTSVLESDGQNYGNQNFAGTNENAIVAFAFHTGGSLLRGDITKQVSTDRYKVENATTTAIAKLKSTIANGAGEMNIVATDASGGTYYVTKLTSRRATLVPAAVARLSTSAGSTYSSGQSAPWSFSAASGSVVQIENT
jgi:hypothetical protein